MNPKNMLSERGQIQKDSHPIIPFTGCSREGTNVSGESRKWRQERGLAAQSHEGTLGGPHKHSTSALGWWLHNCKHLAKLIK